MSILPSDKPRVISQLRQIPGVGKSISEDLWQLGVCSIQDLSSRDPEMLYSEHCAQKGELVDRCILYVFRCAVYFASTAKPDPKLLKWWNWKERGLVTIAHK